MNQCEFDSACNLPGFSRASRFAELAFKISFENVWSSLSKHYFFLTCSASVPLICIFCLFLKLCLACHFSAVAFKKCFDSVCIFTTGNNTPKFYALFLLPHVPFIFADFTMCFFVIENCPICRRSWKMPTWTQCTKEAEQSI
jgi:hypothetical protein